MGKTSIKKTFSLLFFFFECLWIFPLTKHTRFVLGELETHCPDSKRVEKHRKRTSMSWCFCSWLSCSPAISARCHRCTYICNVITFFFYEFIQFVSMPRNLLKSWVSRSEFCSFPFCELRLCFFFKPATQLLYCETHWAAFHLSSSQSYLICRVLCRSLFKVNTSNGFDPFAFGGSLCFTETGSSLFNQIPYFIVETCEEAGCGGQRYHLCSKLAPDFQIRNCLTWCARFGLSLAQRC